MKEKLRVIVGFCLIPIFFLILIFDRMILVFLLHMGSKSLGQWMLSTAERNATFKRVGFVGVVVALITSIRWMIS